jgi:hypothetical protein
LCLKQTGVVDNAALLVDEVHSPVTQ